MKLPANYDSFGCGVTIFCVVGEPFFRMVYPLFIMGGPDFFAKSCVVMIVFIAYILNANQPK